MTRSKTDIYDGKAPRELPLYAPADAARIVRLPVATLRAWAFGRDYPTQSGKQSWQPLIAAADRRARQLSFANLVELHVLSVLRGKHIRVDRIRKATRAIRERIGTEHPFADVDTHTDCVDVYVEILGELINASSPQQLLPAIELRLERIDRDEHGLATRLFPLTRQGAPRLIVIDPARRFGRPVLARANVETSIIAERFDAGESPAELASDFDVAQADVEEALRFERALGAA